MQQATGQLAKPDQFRKVRKDIAGLKTVIVERENAPAKSEVLMSENMTENTECYPALR